MADIDSKVVTIAHLRYFREKLLEELGGLIDGKFEKITKEEINAMFNGTYEDDVGD